MHPVRISLAVTFAAFFGAVCAMEGASVPLLDAIRTDDSDRVSMLTDSPVTVRRRRRKEVVV